MIPMNNVHGFKYFDFSRYWTKKLNPIIQSPQAQSILQQNLKNYIDVKRADYIEYANKNGIPVGNSVWFFVEGQLPADYDSCDWRYGRLPAWSKYVCHGACHFIVNTLLYIAITAYPNRSHGGL
jgi:hypothetical protein